MKSKKPTKFIDAKRRGFMQGAAVAGVTAGVATAAGAASTSAQADNLPEIDVTPKSTDRYAKNDYVKAYYRNARF